MGRVLVTIIFPLVLPTVLYLVWRLWFGRTVIGSSTWVWLLVAGLALSSLTLILLSVDFGSPRDGVYVPPHVENGRVVPGHVEPAPMR